ncbi:DNA-binding transcriptional LysR family regulator [Kribbella voronezhensis]|uniref:DNA-binding transcriptional LysR family regulator n=1 Tax=Kribbella voronezhensis TaxID=2512212 RepID=A0A4R7SZQ5_9ACTN|nr:LysR family transcriptional regulator [Kribbella voronezhensis]TDU84226.1 DNA-binding transcriptional LysR family regulator [Kribbella voronezhensis]
MTTLRALECLVAVLDTGSVTKAAATLHLSQPALSHQLAGLEREIGTPLLERLPRGVRPTTAGRAVADEARAALAAAERVVTVGQAVAKGTEGHLRIACAASMTAGLLAPVLRTWHRRRPGIQLTLTELTSADALAGLVESGQADLAVGPRPTTWQATVDLIGTEELVAAMTPSHPLATTDSVSLADISQYRTIGYDPENGLHAWLTEVLAGHGVAFTPVMRTRQTTTAAELAAAGLGVALVPTTALPSGYTGTIRRLAPPLTRDIVALTPAAGDSAVRAFVNELTRRGLPIPKPIATRLAR